MRWMQTWSTWILAEGDASGGYRRSCRLIFGRLGDVDEVVLAIAVDPGCLGRGEAGEGAAAEGGGLQTTVEVGEVLG
jgi:hypothetical protein